MVAWRCGCVDSALGGPRSKVLKCQSCTQLTPHHRPPKTPYAGIAQYVEQFAAPGDAEYEPQPAQPMPPPEERRFRNPEMMLQARLEAPLKLEK